MSSSDDLPQEKNQISSSDDQASPQEMKQFSSSDDQSPPQEKKQKSEKDDAFFLPYCDRETYYKRLNDHSISFLDDQNRLSDEDCDFTEEEAKLYHDAIEASDGFDVPEFPKVSLIGIITPMSVDDDSLEYLLPFSIAAMDTFNEEKGTEYKVVQVEKATRQVARGLNHYITFLAKVDDDDNTKTFEALVLMGIPKKKGDDATEVIFCREKGTKKVAAEEKLENEDEDSGSVEEEELEGEKMDEFVGA